ncbi:FAD-dependent oxidoreductase [Methanocella sp. MCL-LM]|uniref:FAD-dependent oxidoreductase n=1 Tax=Methanocella sp. MCL-LM TaxID=3412035 RepID=UPI003C776488
MVDAIVIGGGITGAGVARDLALRGLSVTLLEKSYPAAGATGRCHGLLHSGARYAVKDPRAAAECAAENRVVKNMAPHCVEDTGGVFLAIDEADAGYGDRLVSGCKAAGVPVEELSVADSPNPAALRCIGTKDAAVDPFLLTLANLYDAYMAGAEIVTGCGVKRIGDGFVETEDGRTIKGEVIINAAGCECAELLQASGRSAPAVQADHGTLLVTERKVCDLVVNRMRMPGDGDIIVPGHTTSIIGTTSEKSASTIPLRTEYHKLVREAVALLPSMKGVRITRAFAGIRPLLGSGDGRSLSRDYKIFEEQGLITIAGGKLTTYRLVAEHASDAVMRMLGENGRCRTMSEALPDVRREEQGEIECRCESAGRRIIEMPFLKNTDTSRYNRLGFGACQGMRCARFSNSPEEFLQERWKGVRPIIDEGQLQQAYVAWASYKTRLGDRWPGDRIVLPRDREPMNY